MSRRPRREAWVVAAVATAVYLLVAVTQWRSWYSPSWDLAIFTQLAKAYAHLEAPIVPIKGPGFNLLGDHFHPILVLLGPVYRLFPSGLTLLVVQALLVGVSTWPVTALAVRWLGRRPGVLVAVGYALSFGLQGAVRTQFHEIAFALPLLTFGLAALLESRWRAAVVWLGLVVFVKEDLGLLVAVLGLIIWRRGATREGIGLAAWGAGWFLLATTVILPALNPRGQWDYTDNLSVGDALGDPLGTLAAFLGPGEKVVTVLLLVLAAGVVGLRSPILLAALPTLAWRFLGDVSFYWTWLWHYDAVLMPLAAAALLDAVGPRAGVSRGRDPAPAAEDTEDTADTADAVVRSAPDRWSHRTRTRVAVTGTLLAVVLTAPDLPVVGLLDAETYRVPSRAEGAREVLELIPEGATVASDIALLAYLVPTTTTLWSGTADNPAADYYVIDREGSTWGDNPPADAASYAEGKHPGTSYEVVLDSHGYQVAQRATDG
ncbi:DUF2079 domain-containing protein [Georgenia sp. MJ170]|uniref:DUF2079 domain-containing protein n=1 Tax=Georgenia sunbinii TaxID=3117728 RepID=UPI002F26999A